MVKPSYFLSIIELDRSDSMNQLEKWYQLAFEKFKIKEEYSKNKTKQDFISDMKSYFITNIKDEKVIYGGKQVDVSNIKIEWNYRVKEKEDVRSLNSMSILISAITIIATMTTTTFLDSSQIEFENKLILLVALSAIFYFILFLISVAEKHFNMNTNYESSFYEICLMILEDLENGNKN